MRWTELVIGSAWMSLLGGAAWTQVTERQSVATGGAQGDSLSFNCAVSADGRFVAFESSAGNLVPGDANGASDVFVRDRHSGTTERVSVGTGGSEGNAGCFDPSISADGRFVAFRGTSSNLVANDTNGAIDVFVRDRLNATTVRVSVGAGGNEADANAYDTWISADGRFVAFESLATNLVPGDTNGAIDVFVRDRLNATTVRASVGAGGAQGNGTSEHPTTSADGRFVCFHSYATNLVSPGTNGFPHVYVRDLQSGTTVIASVGTGGAYANGGAVYPWISADGRFVAFQSGSSNLVANDVNFETDAFVRDLQAGTTERVSVATGGSAANSSSYDPAISADGRFVAFSSSASNLVAGDTNGILDVFVHDRAGGTTERVSVTTGGVASDGGSWYPALSADGRHVAFESHATNLVAGDTNGQVDAFVHDRAAAGFTSLCEPGAGGVIGCPCGNPPGGPARGCDNSAGTGGASLAAAGVAYLSSDSLVLTTSGGLPSSTSIVLQGDVENAGGAVFGQGVRCAAGTLKRLYVEVAMGGGVTVPDFGAGDPSISTRASALGDVIEAGESRFYLVYYRDPFVLGGCPSASTFNATQTGRVVWSL